jgi:hypothetical protein
MVAKGSPKMGLEQAADRLWACTTRRDTTGADDAGGTAPVAAMTRIGGAAVGAARCIEKLGHELWTGIGHTHAGPQHVI